MSKNGRQIRRRNLISAATSHRKVEICFIAQKNCHFSWRFVRSKLLLPFFGFVLTRWSIGFVLQCQSPAWLAETNWKLHWNQLALEDLLHLYFPIGDDRMRGTKTLQASVPKNIMDRWRHYAVCSSASVLSQASDENVQKTCHFDTGNSWCLYVIYICGMYSDIALAAHHLFVVKHIKIKPSILAQSSEDGRAKLL